MAITALPTAPSRANPTTFSSDADAFLGALPDFATEANALADDVNTKQTIVSTAATTATEQAGIATNAASTATTKASEAIAARNEAVALTESYQGSLANDPSLDKNGNTLSAGDWYINSSTGYIRVYTGSTWVQGISSVSGVSSVNGQTGVAVLNASDVGALESTNPSITGSVTEGVYNLTGTVIDPANGTIQYATLTANTTFTESIADGQAVTLMINPATFTITWPTTTWVSATGNTAPTLTASVYNCITLFQFGGTLYGKFEGHA